MSSTIFAGGRRESALCTPLISARRTRAAALVVCLCAGTAVPGCTGALTGHWRLVEVVPNRQVFSIDDATFKGDGSYAATTTLKGKTMAESGQYKFNGFKLTLQPDGGGRREYNALLRFNELEITEAKHKVVLRRD